MIIPVRVAAPYCIKVSMEKMSGPNEIKQVIGYHEATKHYPGRYARSSGYMVLGQRTPYHHIKNGD